MFADGFFQINRGPRSETQQSDVSVAAGAASWRLPLWLLQQMKGEEVQPDMSLDGGWPSLDVLGLRYGVLGV